MFRSVVAVLCCCTVASRKLAVRPPPQSVPGWLEQGHGTRESPRTLPLVPEIGSASPGTLRWESAVNRHSLRPHRDARPMQPIMTLLNEDYLRPQQLQRDAYSDAVLTGARASIGRNQMSATVWLVVGRAVWSAGDLAVPRLDLRRLFAHSGSRPVLIKQLGSIVLAVVVINLWEETVWAGFFQTRLEARSNFVVAAVLTTLPFAGVHLRCYSSISRYRRSRY
jgi:hypothetical protein